jgi:hypothetical protein
MSPRRSVDRDFLGGAFDCRVGQTGSGWRQLRQAGAAA